MPNEEATTCKVSRTWTGSQRHNLASTVLYVAYSVDSRAWHIRSTALYVAYSLYYFICGILAWQCTRSVLPPAFLFRDLFCCWLYIVCLLYTVYRTLCCMFCCSVFSVDHTAGYKGMSCVMHSLRYLSWQRFHFCFETFHSRLLSRWATAGENQRESIATRGGDTRPHPASHFHLIIVYCLLFIVYCFAGFFFLCVHCLLSIVYCLGSRVEGPPASYILRERERERWIEKGRKRERMR